MSERWPGGIVRSTPVTPTGPLQNGTAPGVWSLADAAYWTKQGLWPTAGNTLAVEDVFSTWLYTGNSSTQTITNGLNLSGSGGMVWVKQRNSAQSHRLYDTSRGVSQMLASNTTSAQANTAGFGVTNFGSSGFTLVDSASNYGVNFSGNTYASWTFREAPKFFDVVTYTGNGVAGRQIAHNLGVAPGMMIVKMTSAVEGWYVYHRGTSSPATKALELNTTAAENAGSVGYWNSTAPTSTNFTLGSNYEVNNNGSTYVAYLYAHDATSDGLIQCGSYTGNGSATGPVVTLGWEPQWVMIKRATGGTNGWELYDSMRGFTMDADSGLRANTSGTEFSVQRANPTATGFAVASSDTDVNASGETYIYMAIRRGPMKTPTLGTSVFNAQANLTTDANKITTGFVTDWFWERGSYTVGGDFQCSQRLTQTALVFNSSAAEGGPYGAGYLMFDYNDGFLSNLSGNINPGLMYGFRRAPSFMDVVCYTGTGATSLTNNHNLGVTPELIIAKCRSNAFNWFVYYGPITGLNSALVLNETSGPQSAVGIFGNTVPTATTFSVGTNSFLNTVNRTYVAYLFASCPGVSKVGSYTGNGSSQTINCAFTTGSRFVMIKRTDTTGDWYVWDSARGIVAGNDPYLALNTTAAQVTTNDSVDTDNTGFIVNQVAASNVNVNGATYLFLAIA